VQILHTFLHRVGVDIPTDQKCVISDSRQQQNVRVNIELLTIVV
jgi:hypothetical protein